MNGTRHSTGLNFLAEENCRWGKNVVFVVSPGDLVVFLVESDRLKRLELLR